MATIQDLNISISEMPRDQAFQLIRDIRQERLKPPKKKKVIRAKQSGAKRKKKNPLDGVSKATLLKLLKES